MAAKQKVYLTHSQILRLLVRIVRLPHGIRRDRFFRLLMRSNAPDVAAGMIPGTRQGARDGGT